MSHLHRRTRAARWLLVLATLGAPDTIHAGDSARATVRVTNSFAGEYHSNNRNGLDGDDDYGAIVNRLNVAGSAGDVATNARVDSMLFIEDRDGRREDETSAARPNPQTNADSSKPRDNDARLERISVRYRLGDWKLELGDYYRQLGRGIALSVRKVDEMGVDVTIRGAQATYHGDTHVFGLFAGHTNPANLDTVTQAFVEDTDDTLVGGAYGFRGLDGIELGVHDLYLKPTEPFAEQVATSDLSHTIGAYVDMATLLDWMSLYIEADYQQRKESSQVKTGRAAYAALDLFVGEFIFIAEGLFLENFIQRGSKNSALDSHFNYSQPPTLERIDQEVLNNTDVLGGRLRVERSFLEGDLVVHANGMVRVNNRNNPEEAKQMHGFAGFELAYQSGRSRVAASGGYRDEQQQIGESLNKTMKHGEFDYLQSLGGLYSFHLTSTNELRTLEKSEYARGSTAVGVELAGTGALTVELGYDTQKRSEGIRNYFIAGLVSWHPTDAIQLRGTVGNQRGGIKCVAGVCRDFPHFSGVRLDIVTRHGLGS